MSKFSYFSENKAGSPHQEEGEYKQPDEVFIQGEEGFSKDNFTEKNKGHKPKTFMNRSRLSPRFLSCLGFIFSLLFGVMILIGSLPSLFFATLFLFRNQPLNQVVKRLWKLSSNAFIVSAGFLVGIVSPRLGFGLILLYLSWHAGQDQFSQTIRRLFST